MRAFVASPCVGVERAARVLRAPHRKEIGKRPCGRRWGADGKPSGRANEGPYSQMCNLHIALRLPRCYPSLSAAKIGRRHTPTRETRAGTTERMSSPASCAWRPLVASGAPSRVTPARVRERRPPVRWSRRDGFDGTWPRSRLVASDDAARPGGSAVARARDSRAVSLRARDGDGEGDGAPSSDVAPGASVGTADPTSSDVASASSAEPTPVPSSPPKRRRGRPKGTRKVTGAPVPGDAMGVASLLWRLSSDDEARNGKARIQPHGIEAVVPRRRRPERDNRRDDDADELDADELDADELDADELDATTGRSKPCVAFISSSSSSRRSDGGGPRRARLSPLGRRSKSIDASKDLRVSSVAVGGGARTRDGGPNARGGGDGSRDASRRRGDGGEGGGARG